MSQEHLNHLAYAQRVIHEQGIALGPASVTPLSIRYGRSIFKIQPESGGSLVMRIHNTSFLGRDVSAKFERRKDAIHAAGIATPDVIYSESAKINFQYQQNSQTETLCLEMQEYIDSPSWQTYLQSLCSTPETLRSERIKAYERVGSVIRRLSSIPTEASSSTFISSHEYGQYADEAGYIERLPDFHEYVQLHISACEDMILGNLRYPDIFTINSQLIHRTRLLVDEETRYWDVEPHLVHLDLQLGNILRNGTVIDWDYLGAGCLPMEWAKIVDNIKTPEELEDFKKGMCSPVGLGLTEEAFNTILQDAYVWILVDNMDRLANRVHKLRLGPEDIKILENVEGDKVRKQELLEDINRLRRRQSTDPTLKEYIGDYKRWIREIDARQTSSIMVEAAKIKEIQARLAIALDKVGMLYDGLLLGPRSRLARDAWPLLDGAIGQGYTTLASVYVHYSPRKEA